MAEDDYDDVDMGFAALTPSFSCLSELFSSPSVLIYDLSNLAKFPPINLCEGLFRLISCDGIVLEFQFTLLLILFWIKWHTIYS